MINKHQDKMINVQRYAHLFVLCFVKRHICATVLTANHIESGETPTAAECQECVARGCSL